MGSPAFIRTHTCVLPGKWYEMSALFRKDVSMLEEIEWGHFSPPSASDRACVPPSGRNPASSDSLPLGEMKP